MDSSLDNVALGGHAPRQQDRLYHDLLSPEEVRRLRARVRAFAEREIAPRAHAIAHTPESVESFPRAVFHAMADEGLFAVPFPTAVGGAGLEHPACATATVIEELAYHSNSVAAIFDVHCILAGHALTFASPELQERCLRAITSGAAVGAFATSEPHTSTDLTPSALGTEAREVEGGWVVRGRKRWITNAPVADFAVILCRTGERATTLLVDLDADGVRVGTPDRKLGNRGQLTADIELDDVFVPSDSLVGTVGGGLAVALAVLNYGRVGIAAAGVGMAQAAFDEAVERLKTRQAFGRPLAANQHWQFRFAQRATELEVARSLFLKAALRLDAGERFPDPEAAMAKTLGSSLAVDLARDAVQVFGGYGFVEELGADGSTYHVQQIYRDAKIGEIYEGTTEVQQWLIARAIFGEDLTG